MKSLNNNGVSTCMAGQENYVYFNLMPRLRRKSRYCQYDSAMKKTVSYSQQSPQHWKYAGSAGMNG